MAFDFLLFPLLGILCLLTTSSNAGDPEFLIGAGSYDITGPAADVNMMGYANPSQNAAGIHLRLRSRAFIVAEPFTNGKRIAYVSLDACMASQAVTLRVLSKLKERYGDLYNAKNVAISGIHTHSGPGGYLQYVLYIVTSLGFVRQSFDAVVDGIVASITRAHENLRPGSIYSNEGELLDANINRSPSAYLNNPEEERKKYKYDVDKDMLLLKFVDAEWGPVASLNWFPVHCTSMNNTNKLVSGDNKGAAARFMEDWFDRQTLLRKKDFSLNNIRRTPAESDSLVVDGRSSGGAPLSSNLPSRSHRVRSSRASTRPPFVAAFAQTNEGDVSPNTLGPFCGDSNIRCDFNHSTCNGRNELCIARGPGYPDHFESTRIIAQRQTDKAIELYAIAKDKLSGRVDYRHAYLDLSSINVTLSDSAEVVRTCAAAVGFSFAAGTTDGPGAFDFTQGDSQGNAFWKIVGGALKKPSDEQVACQKPKPVLIDTGEMFTPYAWAPAILPIQILQFGGLFILTVPAEFSTMAGRRLRESIKETLVEKSNGKYKSDDIRVVISGLTNSYSQYVTTYEEYQIQRYEGASTLYGPHTLSAYVQEFKKLATAMAEDRVVEDGPTPPDMVDKQLSLLPGVVVDSTPLGVSFGDMKKDVAKNSTYRSGDEVEVIFWTGCPRNDLMTEGTFALVEFLNGEKGVWIPAYDDDDWSVKFMWGRPFAISPHSWATITWSVPHTAATGTYRIRHFGSYKHLFGSIKHFTGASSTFFISN